jgi:hypothetical protein
VKRQKPRKARKACLTEADEEKLLAACQVGPSYLQWCVRIALATAMCASEIRRIERRYIDIARCNIHLPTTKNGDERDVPRVLNGAVEPARFAVPGHQIVEPFFWIDRPLSCRTVADQG